MARRPAPAGSSATSASGATHTPAVGERADIEPLPPGVVARAQHHKPVASQRGQPITEFAGQRASGQSEQQAEFGVGRFAVFGHVERHGVLVAVDEHQPDLTDVIAQPGDDAEQRRAVAAVDDREPARGHRRPDPFVQRVGHREQRRVR